jgi:hypothetical protein
MTLMPVPTDRLTHDLQEADAVAGRMLRELGIDPRAGDDCGQEFYDRVDALAARLDEDYRRTKNTPAPAALSNDPWMDAQGYRFGASVEAAYLLGLAVGRRVSSRRV